MIQFSRGRTLCQHLFSAYDHKTVLSVIAQVTNSILLEIGLKEDGGKPSLLIADHQMTILVNLVLLQSLEEVFLGGV
jgi:hypothetical protein